MCNVNNAVLRGEFMELNVYIRKEERSTIDVSFYLKNLGKEEVQYRSTINRRKEIIKKENQWIENGQMKEN